MNKKLFIIAVIATLLTANVTFAGSHHHRHSGLYTTLDVINTVAHVIDVLTPNTVVVQPPAVVTTTQTTYAAPTATTQVVTTPVYTTPVVTTPVYTTPVVTTPVYTTPVYTTPYYYRPLPPPAPRRAPHHGRGPAPHRR